jgi:hypothetical protein
MSDYTKTTTFAGLGDTDALPAVFDTEFDGIQTSNNTKVDKTGATMTGHLVILTGAATTQAVQAQEIYKYAFVAGTSMVFHQAAAPTGWAQDLTVQDGSMMRMVSGAGGAAIGGTHDANLGVPASATGAHAITIAQMPAHTHAYTASASTIVNGADASGETVGSPVSARTSGSTGSGATHTHTLTSWVPKYSNVIVCTKS